MKKRDIQAGISSSNSRELILMVLRAHEIEDYFACVTTCCEVPASKPAPDVYLKQRRSWELNPVNAWCLRMSPWESSQANVQE